MSNQLLSLVWHARIPSHTQKIVLLALADHADETGLCWPSLDTLSERCGLSRQAVIDQLEKLQSAGFLKVAQGGGRRANRYTVTVNTVDQNSVVAVQPIDYKNKPVVNAVDQNDIGMDSVVVNVVDPSSQRRLQQQSTPDIVAVNGVDPIPKEPSLIPQRRGSAPLPNLNEVFDTWNDKADNLRLPKCLLLSDKRRIALVARLADKFFAANWRAALEKLSASSFCKGVNDRGWVATFEWFITRDSVVKIMEGKYDNRSAPLQHKQIGMADE